MVAADFLQDPRVQGWLDGVEPAWTLLTSESLRALRHEPSAVQTAIRIANDLSVGEIAGSPVARNTLILLRQAIERVGLPLTATGNLSRAAVAEMCTLIEWPDYDQADAFRFNKVINEPDFLPLYVVRQLGRFPRLSSRLNGPVMTSKRKGPPRAKRYSHKPSPATVFDYSRTLAQGDWCPRPALARSHVGRHRDLRVLDTSQVLYDVLAIGIP